MKARFTFGSILSPPKACKYLRFDVCAGARSKAAFGCIPNNISCLVLLAFLLIIIIIIIFVSSAPCTVNCTALHCYYTGKYPVIMQEVVNIYGTLHSPRASKQIPSWCQSVTIWREEREDLVCHGLSHLVNYCQLSWNATPEDWFAWICQFNSKHLWIHTNFN